MTDRTCRLVQLVAAVALLLGASAARAADEEPFSRVADLDLGVGVHWGIEESTPLNDDVIAGIGAAVGILSRLDVEGGAYYLSGRDFETDSGRDAGYFHLGLRWYPTTDPEIRTRWFISTGPAVMLDYRNDDDVTPAYYAGVGLRMRFADRAGMMLRLPVTFMVDGDTDALMLPMFSIFYQL